MIREQYSLLVISYNSPIKFAQQSIRCRNESQLIFMTNVADYDSQERFGCVVHANFCVLQRLQTGNYSTLWLSESVWTKLFITFEETVYYVISKTSAHRSRQCESSCSLSLNGSRPRLLQSFQKLLLLSLHDYYFVLTSASAILVNSQRTHQGHSEYLACIHQISMFHISKRKSAFKVWTSGVLS